MKVRPKLEPQQRLTLRVPTSLKNQIDATAKLADDRGVDYFATLVDVIAKFNVDLTAQLGAESSTNPVTKSAPDQPQVGDKVGARNSTGSVLKPTPDPASDRNGSSDASVSKVEVR